MSAGFAAAAARLQEAAAARKCWPCGCLHQALASIAGASPEGGRPPELEAALGAARARLEEVRYDCLGCAVCYPAEAVNALAPGLATCGAAVEAREGWPPLPGDYTVLRYRAAVAVCTLTDAELARAAAAAAPPGLAIAGTLQTENLGIERLVANIVANPHVRFLMVSGADSRQAIGHLPGQSLVALARAGVDGGARIAGARGRRPLLRNLAPPAIEHFRRTVEVVDLVGASDLAAVLEAVASSAARDPGPAEPFALARAVTPVAGYLPERMVPDPAGYLVVDVDRRRRLLALEHYRKDGVLDAVIEGRTAAELIAPAVEQGLVSRLDHAAYLGRELERAERALAAGEPHVQDAAPERASSGCGTARQEAPSC
jgi:tetrahydromethanopterin S-methyltransferase subunit A